MKKVDQRPFIIKTGSIADYYKDFPEKDPTQESVAINFGGEMHIIPPIKNAGIMFDGTDENLIDMIYDNGKMQLKWKVFL